ncbi:hypothetical protein [Novosphingobium ovatum]|uniref:hypothetical protein n=1 Tax=Novosphingobium ovatum TaxID=1908523 RepID=UPI001D10116D|nr:hypothetical protein [Novosphingobium ovatum]
MLLTAMVKGWTIRFCHDIGKIVGKLQPEWRRIIFPLALVLLALVATQGWHFGNLAAL